MLRRAARAASQFLEHYLEPVGLHASQFGILNKVSKAGSMAMTRLSDEMSLDRTTVTRNLQIMERENLVSIVPGSDRRIREVVLTEHGKKVLKEALPLWQEAEETLSARLGKEHRDALLTILSAVNPPLQK